MSADAPAQPIVLRELLGDILLRKPGGVGQAARPVSVTELQGRYVGLYFSAHWCVLCNSIFGLMGPPRICRTAACTELCTPTSSLAVAVLLCPITTSLHRRAQALSDLHLPNRLLSLAGALPAGSLHQVTVSVPSQS